MEDLDGHPIRPIKEVVREHVEATLTQHPEVPRYRIALELGVSPTTLYRMLNKWDEAREER